MMDGCTPVIVGVGQRTFRDGRVDEPLTVIEAAARAAITDTSRATATAERIDACWVVNILSARYSAPATALAGRLGLGPGDRLTTTIGGNTPQGLMARACDLIAAGLVRAVLIAGGEAGAGAALALQRGESCRVTEPSPAAVDPITGDSRQGVGQLELAAGVVLPAHIYPWFESALAARDGRDPVTQQHWLGDFLAPVGRRAADHPDLAWFPEARSASDIAEVTADNRMVAEPYTKRMNSILAVDQGAATVVMAANEATAAGIPRERWVFPWSAASCVDVFYPSLRPDLSRSPAIAAAGASALRAAGVGIDDIAYLDFYSCFPCALQLGADALGVALSDSRGLTLTGGMPAFGGPGNNYTAHGIAMAVEALRADRSALALTTGVGWYMTKHAIGIYSDSPPPLGWQHAFCGDEEARIASVAHLPADNAHGDGVIVAGTIVHDRQTGPVSAPVLVDLDSGGRTVALAAESSAPASLSGATLVGMRVRLRQGDGCPVWDPR